MNEKIVKLELTMAEIRVLPNMLGRIASAMCKEHGEYKCRRNNVKTHIVLIEG